MFFPKKLRSILKSDKVLEIGPGSHPHPRSNVFLELRFANPEEKLKQRGGIDQEANFGKKPIIYYDGKEFPFKDNEFDYVICSHVIEHVPNLEFFMNEIFRVGNGKGYIEYPLITYDYLYDFEVHLNFIKYNSEDNTLLWKKKSSTHLNDFLPITALLRQMLALGWDDLCSSNKDFFFEGFEFKEKFYIREIQEISKLLPLYQTINKKKFFRKRINQVLNKVKI